MQRLLAITLGILLIALHALGSPASPPGAERAQPLSPRIPPAHSAPAAHLAYWTDTRRGWHFYEDPEVEEPARRSRASPSIDAASAAPSRIDERPIELQEFERLQKTLEDYRHIAIMRPSEANVRRYMELESRVVARASYFADVAQRVAWSTPELDPSLQGRPMNAKALEVFEQQQRSDRSDNVSALGRDHVLIFFFRSDCPYCHAFAPTLQAFEARYGLQVVPVSIDGGPLPGYPHPRRDNGIATTLKVTQVPAVFLAQPFTGRIVPIGFGVLSESQLLERVSIVSSPDSGSMPPGITQRLATP